MVRHTTVKFRGESWDVVVDHDGGYEPDTGAHEIDWHFDGLDAEAHARLNLTDMEEQGILDQLYEQSWEGDNDVREL